MQRYTRARGEALRDVHELCGNTSCESEHIGIDSTSRLVNGLASG